MLLFIFIQLIEYAGSPDKLGIWGIGCVVITLVSLEITNKTLNFFHFSLKTKIIFLQSFVILEEIYKKICMEGVGLEKRFRGKSRSGLPTKDEKVDSA